MRQFYLSFLIFCLLGGSMQAQNVCNSNGNLMIFSNYEGGNLTVNVDVNIPFLRIAVVTYESATVTFTGPFVNNIISVDYAGYGDTADQSCGSSVGPVAFNGLPGGVIPTIAISPASTLPNSGGSPTMDCGYQCASSGNQGGCNTSDQIVHFFTSQYVNSFLYAHYTSYSCWNGVNRNIATGGNCCIQASPSGFTTTRITNIATKMYPNPANKEVHIESAIPQQYTLTTPGGQVLKSGEVVEGRSTLDISMLAAGIYLLRFAESAQVLKLRVIP